MFILPLMAILLGIEFFLVFDRVTKSYEKSLTEGYTMLVVTKKPMKLEEFKALNSRIATSSEITQKMIVDKMAKGMSKNSIKKIFHSLPYFYNVGLDSYLEISVIENIKIDLEESPKIQRVETFGNSYTASYKLFTFIKLIFNIFIAFMGVVSLFLIIKQMEIWKYAHKERMQVMEIFGASRLFRSKVLYKMALADAFLATLFVSGIFSFIKWNWAINSGIEIISSHQEFLFTTDDMIILFLSSLVIVFIAVYVVVFSNRGVPE